MGVFSNGPDTGLSTRPGLALTEDVSFAVAMAALMALLDTLPEGRRVRRIEIIREGELLAISQLTSRGIQISAKQAAEVLAAEATYINNILLILERYADAPQIRDELARRADVIFDELDIELRTTMRLVQQELVKVIVRSLGTERPLSFLDRWRY